MATAERGCIDGCSRGGDRLLIKASLAVQAVLVVVATST